MGFPFRLARVTIAALLATVAAAFGADPAPVVKPSTDSTPLPTSAALAIDGDLSQYLRHGVHRFLDRKTQESIARRPQFWHRDTSSAAAYERSVAPNRRRLASNIGAVDPLAPPAMRKAGEAGGDALVARTPKYSVYQVSWPALVPVASPAASAGEPGQRWPTLAGPLQVEGEGLLIEPMQGDPKGFVVVVPDADQTPEQVAGLADGMAQESQMARRLAENGFTVLVVALVNRDNKFSRAAGATTMPHRAWIYRQGFEMGRHVIGYEVQKVRAAVNWFKQRAGPQARVGVAGYGEGGLIALYGAAVEPQIDAALVSGYFGPREELWREPLYRNVWALLREFGDAEIAALVAPRGLVIEYSKGPEIATDNRYTGPGRLTTREFAAVRGEFERIGQLIGSDEFQQRCLIHGEGAQPVPAGSKQALQSLGQLLGTDAVMDLSDERPADARKAFNPDRRQERMVKAMENHTQLTLRNSESLRDAAFHDKIDQSSLAAYSRDAQEFRRTMWSEAIGMFDDPLVAINPRTRKIYDSPRWTGYDVVLDVWPEVIAWGVLCIPKDLKEGERRPVVVCQHGLEGVPRDTIEAGGAGYGYYKGFTAALADRGFVTFAPHNLYRGGTDFRLLQRKANPLKASLFSIITAQHQQLVNFLQSLPCVDPKRIAFYGLSYGGKTAMRVPVLEERYCLSICSGDFNEWVRINADVHCPNAYMYRDTEWEMPEWNLGHTFNYAEMADLILPRPFMVERGHGDPVGCDEWVAYEFARARRPFDKLGLGDRCVIEYFDGPHTIHGVGTFEFLRRNLDFPLSGQ